VWQVQTFSKLTSQHCVLHDGAWRYSLQRFHSVNKDPLNWLDHKAVAELENIGSPINMHTLAGNGRRQHSGSLGYAIPAMVTIATVQP